MKKILTAIVTLTLLATLAVGAYAEDVTGDWYAEVYGMVMKMTVNADNTYVLEAGGDSAPGTWELDGTNLIVDKGTETESVFTYDAAAQVLDMAGEMTFTRTAMEAWAPAAVRTEAALADFEGIWTAMNVDCFGALLPVDAAGVYMDALITGNNVSVTINFIEAETFEGEAVLDNGTLTMTVPAKDEYSSASVFTMNALEDGMIAITTELFSAPATFYLEQPMILD
ncbi:MAG: hypothetical protein IKU34_10920 [Clostridia bacterium]|nr:hypothetical protein [Clostridia bacterium]